MENRLRSSLVPVGAGEGRRGVGTLASPWVEGEKSGKETGRGRRKRPHRPPHHPRPYGYDVASHLAIRKLRRYDEQRLHPQYGRKIWQSPGNHPATEAKQQV